MESVANIRFTDLVISEDKSYIKIRWNYENKYFSKEIFLQELNEISSKIRNLSISKFLLDLTGMDSYFPTELHNFKVNDIVKIFNGISIKKMALLLPDNIFSRILLEASYLSLFDKSLNIHFFSKTEDAERWLISG